MTNNHIPESDNILEFPAQKPEFKEQQERKKITAGFKKNNKNYKSIIILGVVVLLTIFAFIIRENHSEINKSDGDASQNIIDNLNGESYAFEAYRDGYIYARNGKITYYTANQEPQWEVSGSKTSPKLAVSDEYVLTYYPNDKFVILTDGENTKKIKTDGGVSYAHINKRGYCALIMEENGFKNQVAVYDNTGKALYKWHNSDEYVTAVQLSDNNKHMIASAVGFDNNKVGAKILIFDITKKADAENVKFNDAVICAMQFIGKKDFIVVLDNETVCCDINKKTNWKIDYNGKNLCTYDVNSIGNTALVFGDDSAMSGSEVLFYNRRGKLKGEGKTDKKVSQIDMQGSTALAVCERELKILNSKGKLLGSQKLSYDARKCYFLGDKKTALAIAGSGAYVVSTNK